jgi:broad specificity phosphatase PhoE
MPQLYLLRHAQSEANQRGILAGPDNTINLSEKGRKQSLKVSKHLQAIAFQQIYSSPISRCLQTIQPLIKGRPNIEIVQEIKIQEMDYGQWNGKDLKILSKKRDWQRIQSAPSKFTFPDGESFNQLRRRVTLFLSQIADKDGPILVVSHGDVIKMMLACTLDLPTDKFQNFVIEPASISIVHYGSKVKNIISVNQKVEKSSTKERFSSFLLGGDNA